MRNNIEILLVDDHRIVRNGLRLTIQQHSDLVVVGEASDGRSALEQATALAPDLVIMDIHLPDIDGILVSRQILERQPSIKIITLSADADMILVNSALQSGVSGYILKDSPPEQLIQAIRSGSEGKIYLCPEVATAVVQGYKKTLLAQDPHLLSERERQVLKLIAQGRRNKEIAAELGVSTKSVETYRSRMMAKLGYANAAELVRYAVREGIVDP